MSQNRFELEIESRVENLRIISDFVKNALAQLGVDPAFEYNIQLVVDEACTNIIKHAYAGDVGPIALILEMREDELIIIMKDKGKPFDFGSVPPPDLAGDLESRKIGGLGIFLMKSLMDEVNYQFDAQLGNELTMRKTLSFKNKPK